MRRCDGCPRRADAGATAGHSPGRSALSSTAIAASSKSGSRSIPRRRRRRPWPEASVVQSFAHDDLGWADGGTCANARQSRRARGGPNRPANAWARKGPGHGRSCRRIGRRRAHRTGRCSGSDGPDVSRAGAACSRGTVSTGHVHAMAQGGGRRAVERLSRDARCEPCDPVIEQLRACFAVSRASSAAASPKPSSRASSTPCGAARRPPARASRGPRGDSRSEVSGPGSARPRFRRRGSAPAMCPARQLTRAHVLSTSGRPSPSSSATAIRP